MVNRDNFESVVDYTTVLSNFSGPLDLLLFLINREEIEIKDIFVSQVTEQFLDYMKGLPYIDVDKVSEYLAIASSILRIKAYDLVPNVEQDPELQEEIEAEKDALVKALYEEYKLIKEEVHKLKELETIGYFFKEPDEGAFETRTVFNLDNVTLEGMIDAFSRLMIKRQETEKEAEAREIPKDRFTVAEKVTYILEALEEGGEKTFEELFEEDCSRPEIVTTFQAMLELLKLQYLRVRQEQAFGEICISLNPERKEEDLGSIDEYH